MENIKKKNSCYFLKFYINKFFYYSVPFKAEEEGEENEEKQVENKIDELEKKFLENNNSDLEIPRENEENPEKKTELVPFIKFEGTMERSHTLEANIETKIHKKKKELLTSKQIFFQTFLMTLLAEWGDKSQIATVLLSANQNPILVGLGASLVI